MLKCPLSALPKCFSALSREYALYLPADQKSGAEFSKYDENSFEWSRAHNTKKGVKRFFFPQTEDLFEFQTGEELKIDPLPAPDEKTVLFGIRECDRAAISLLDRVFLADPTDGYYAARRENTAIVTEICTRPSGSCFCGAFGIDPCSPAGDIAVLRWGEHLYLEPKTEKGERILRFFPCEDADENEISGAIEKTREKLEKLPLHALSAKSIAGGTDKYFESPVWEEFSQSCLGCGGCTFVCPTCQCYDIRDFDTGDKIVRSRCWDSCMYSDFTLMSAGQPRPTRKERFRQRFMHKLVYFPENNGGVFGCVGCGRCVDCCPSGLHTAKIIKALGE